MISPAAGGPTGALEPLLILVFVLGAALVLVIGVLVGVLAGRSRRPPAPAERP